MYIKKNYKNLERLLKGVSQGINLYYKGVSMIKNVYKKIRARRGLLKIRGTTVHILYMFTYIYIYMFIYMYVYSFHRNKFLKSFNK